MITLKNTVEENINQEFRLKDIDETRTDLIEEINWNDLMSKEHKKVYTTLNYIEESFAEISAVTGCVFISAFASLLGICIGSASSAVGLKTCVPISGIRYYKSIIKKGKKTQ